MSGAIKSVCSVCGATFSSVAAFDFHRVGPYVRGGRHCLTASEMQAEGMIQDERGWWKLPEAPAQVEKVERKST